MSEAHTFPKILVVDPTPFNRIRNNGIVKSNLFQGWPQTHLAQIDYSNIEPGFDVCNRYWSLKKIDILKGFFGAARVAVMPIPDELPEKLGTYDSVYENRSNIERKLSVLHPQLRTLIGEAIFCLPSVLSPPLRRWIDEFNPDAVFSILSTSAILRTVVRISEWRDIPIIPYFTDDWITTQYKEHFLEPLLRHDMEALFDRCLKRSPISLTCCDAMADEYTKRYGGVFKSFTNTVNAVQERVVEKSSGEGPVRLVYIGGLAPGRWQTLREIGEALQQLRAEQVCGELLIYTFPSEITRFRDELTVGTVMRIVGTAAPEEVQQLQLEADVLVHVESFEPANREYTRFSLSTKIPQYMMAGACILGYGPGEVASIKYLKDTEAAFTIGLQNSALLKEGLRELIRNKSLRHDLGSRARYVAIEKHDSTKQRELFRQTLEDSCSRWHTVVSRAVMTGVEQK